MRWDEESDADELLVLCLCSSLHWILCWASAYTECTTPKQWLLIIKQGQRIPLHSICWIKYSIYPIYNGLMVKIWIDDVFISFADDRGSLMAKTSCWSNTGATSGASASNDVEKEMKNSHALTGTGPQTATGTLHLSPWTLAILSEGIWHRLCLCVQDCVSIEVLWYKWQLMGICCVKKRGFS